MSEATQYRLRLPDGNEYGPVSMDTIVGWTRQSRVPRNASLVEEPDGTVRPVMDVPELHPFFQAMGAAASHHDKHSSISSLIPYRNVPALTGYYLSIAALLPIIGLPIGLVAVILGVVGLSRVRANPACKGTVHAWIAIALGTIGFMISLVMLVLLMIPY
ncbi:MAG: DUF4190 domain-containing protein [Phycisphaerales bacterium]|nr:MAG: DUF4190 domain-containing protein [Phycisphaerales bacterium]